MAQHENSQWCHLCRRWSDTSKQIHASVKQKVLCIDQGSVTQLMTQSQ
jgi:hypothetical protein